MDLDDVADGLYEGPPEEFIERRKVRQDEAKADGDKALAKEIGALPKPSAAAWACNLLVREHRGEIEDLVELGDLLREAQENLAGDQLRALDVQRRQLVTALTRQARGLAAGRGHPVSTAVATQVEETLRAAMADPDAGRALLTGRLTSPMSYSGLGTTVSKPDLRLVHPAPRTERPTTPETKATPARKAAGGSAADRRAREQEERRRAAEATAAEAERERQRSTLLALTAEEALWLLHRHGGPRSDQQIRSAVTVLRRLTAEEFTATCLDVLPRAAGAETRRNGLTRLTGWAFEGPDYHGRAWFLTRKGEWFRSGAYGSSATEGKRGRSVRFDDVEKRAVIDEMAWQQRVDSGLS